MRTDGSHFASSFISCVVSRCVTVGPFWFLQVDQWLDTCWNDFEVPVQAMAAASGNQGVIGEAKRHSLAFLAAANACLEKRWCVRGLFFPHLCFAACCLASAKVQFRAFCVPFLSLLHVFEVECTYHLPFPGNPRTPSPLFLIAFPSHFNSPP